MTLAETGARYARDVSILYSAGSTTEETYYPALRELCAALLESRNLPFQVRVNTTEQRSAHPGADRPDLAFYDRSDFVAVFGEVKLPATDVAVLAHSTERSNQVGRYLSQTGVVVLLTVRAIGLVACRPGYHRQSGIAVAPKDRELLDVVEFWSSESGLRRADPIPDDSLDRAAELLERAVTEFAPIATPASLALILARQARRARIDLPERFDTVRTLLADYQAALGLTFTETAGEEFFRSSLIQTAFYALFAGWTLWHRRADGRPFAWDRLDDYLRIPFLGKLFYEFRHPDRLAELGLAAHLDRATATLARVDREAFFRGFTYGAWREPSGDSGEEATAITYFYEPFLEAFDPDLRKELGVWYTPPEIVRYQVRKVDRLLRERLECRRGFADERVVVLDPCCGTGAYLLEVISCIAEEILARGDDAILAAELLQAVTNRVVGFEILTAPFVIAQLQIYMLLSDLGVPPGPGDRPAVFLTNALTGWSEVEQVRLNFPELQQEHEAAREVKRSAPILVILGNPPYNRFVGTALDEEAELVDHYKGIARVARRDRKGQVVVGQNGRPEMVQQGDSALYTRWRVRKQLLDDLYIRFFRLAERRIADVGQRGVVSFISNSSYLTGRSHPLMRESLVASFDEIWLDNMHGNRLASERTPSGESCETLFSFHGGTGIRVGTAISTLVRTAHARPAKAVAQIHYRDFWGKASLKRHALLNSLRAVSPAVSAENSSRPEGPREYERITPRESTRWLFCPRDENVGFESWASVDELFPVSYQGVNPNRGLQGSLVAMTAAELTERMQDYFSEMTDAEVSSRHPVLMTPRARYVPSAVRTMLRGATRFRGDQIARYLTFPLDERWVYYETEAKLLNERRPEFWENLQDNEFFVTVPQPRRVSESLPLVTSSLVDLHVHDRGSVCFPAWLRAGEGLYAHEGPNIPERTREVLARAWPGARCTQDASGRLMTAHLFRAAMALMHAPLYQSDHAEALAQDWAHLPLPRDAALLERLVDAGVTLATLLDPDREAEGAVESILGHEVARTLGVLRATDGRSLSEKDLRVTISYFGAAKGRWIPTEASTGHLHLNDEVFLANVPAPVWEYELGGYPVVRKWLGYRHIDRLGRALTLAEARHLRSVVQRLSAVLAMGHTLDDLYGQSAAAALTAEELGVR